MVYFNLQWSLSTLYRRRLPTSSESCSGRKGSWRITTQSQGMMFSTTRWQQGPHPRSGTMQHVACRSPHGSLWGGFEETAAVQLPHSSKVKRCLSDVLTSPFGMVFGCKSKSELSIGFYFSEERSLSIFLVFTCPQLQSWI